jgi:putative ABC transport system permease protein
LDSSGVGEIIPNRGTVVGILAPFCFGTLPPDDEPIEIECGTNLVNMHVRLKEPFADNLRMLNNEMKKIYPQEEIEFTSLERALERGYRPTMIFRDTTILAFITILFITLMGLIGYTNDEVRRRGKEIAIRKINGAEVSSVLLLLSKDIFWVAIPSITIGTYGAYLVSQIWISQFRDTVCISIGWYVAIAICLLAFIIICIIWKSWHIANENPVNSIKSE